MFQSFIDLAGPCLCIERYNITVTEKEVDK